MIFLYEGSTGQGKTYMTAVNTILLLERNKKWYEKKKTEIKRVLATNMKLSPEVENRYPDQILYWTDLDQLIGLRECDVIFDDMASYLDSQRWSDTPMSVKRWLRLHEHYGCDIYGNAQDFLTIDISVRRLCTGISRVTKVIGSRRPSATKPIIKFIWGLMLLREIDISKYKTETQEKPFIGFPKLEFIKRKYCNTFDTKQDIQQSEYPPLQHIERSCLTCNEVKTKHI